ncbi:MAG: class I SAM-dependent methyltransferase [Armatimonadetes bacterium]|nr:class I SAM-dependent methyltransferase [Armatimonadota bacterium]
MRLLGDVKGKRVLEIGCGGGQCSIAFAREGADCTGVDLSDEQIAFARALADREGIRAAFHQGDMTRFLEGQPEGVCDIVFSAFAFQYIEDLARVFRGTRRILKPGGLFVFSLDHPLCDVTVWEDGRVVFTDSYFARGRMAWDWDHGPGIEPTPCYSFHRTTADFLNLLVEAGFTVERLIEPEPPTRKDAWVARYPGQEPRYYTVPATIIWKARAR